MERTTSIIRSVCVTEMVQRGIAVAGVSAQPPQVGAPARVETERSHRSCQRHWGRTMNLCKVVVVVVNMAADQKPAWLIPASFVLFSIATHEPPMKLREAQI